MKSWRIVDKVPERGDTVTPRDCHAPATVVCMDHQVRPGPKLICELDGERYSVWPDQVEVIE